MNDNAAGGAAISAVVAIEPEHDGGDDEEVRRGLERFGAEVDGQGGRAIVGHGNAAFEFDDPAAAVEAAVRGLWATQRMDPPWNAKLRVGVATGAHSLRVSTALLAAANGNQILITQETDRAVPGLDARGLGALDLPGEPELVVVWLLTDSRTDIDRRPPRVG